jgi:hypothetical protein
MENVIFIDSIDPYTNEVTVYAIIDRGNDIFTSMPKAVWDEQQPSN